MGAMRRGLRRAAVLAAATATAVGGLSACGAGDDDAPIMITQLGADAVPASILGLRVEQEDVAERLAASTRPYVDTTGLYSLREGDRLQATLQVSRFADGVDVESERFRAALVQQIGSTQPKPFRMGDHVVYLTASKRQSVAIAFGDRSFLVLSTLETFDRSRALLRAVMELGL